MAQTVRPAGLCLATSLGIPLRRQRVAIEERLGIVFSEAQRYEALLRSQAEADGTWHNAVVFRRDGRMTSKEPLVTGVDWHLPPEAAMERARQLGDVELLELLQRALRPRTPLL